jgi:hypothetical protein
VPAGGFSLGGVRRGSLCDHGVLIGVGSARPSEIDPSRHVPPRRGRGEDPAASTANGEPFSTFKLVAPDLPSADHQGPAGRAREFRKLDERIEPQPCSMMWPRCRRSNSLAADTEARLPLSAGAH